MWVRIERRGSHDHANFESDVQDLDGEAQADLTALLGAPPPDHVPEGGDRGYFRVTTSATDRPQILNIAGDAMPASLRKLARIAF